MARLRTTQIVGIILLIVGVAVLVYGLTSLSATRETASYQITKFFKQKSNAEEQALIFTVSGGVVTALGLVVFFIRPPAKKRRKKR